MPNNKNVHVWVTCKCVPESLDHSDCSISRTDRVLDQDILEQEKEQPVSIHN